ncbi:unnamed protein product [Phytophthora lilii]|uniref:Unnamed protein product n=1 Tax=Phytophthora lilii TaxID=2077276 RepID=A0A9W7D7H5_9STRA|nr:unnamed protein product [Phytophthora lilii]
MAMGNIGAAHEVLHDIVSALSWYGRALGEIEATPGMIFADNLSSQSSRMHLMVHIVRAKLSACVWANAEDEFDSLWLLATSLQAVYAFTPFDSLLHAIPPMDRKTLAIHFSTKYEAVAKNRGNFEALLQPPKEINTTKLNIGYLSYDFSDHPTAHLVEGLFATRDQNSTNVVAFGYGRDDNSAFRQRIVESVDKFIDLSALSYEESAAQIRDANIHIIMDAQGHTRRGRMQIAAARPAPIMVNYLVFPGTSGAPFMDYVIVDKYVVPPAELASAFSEKLVVMPNSYQVNYYKDLLVTPETIYRRADLWRTEQNDVKTDEQNGFVFVNFNKIDKLKASVFSTWMSIMQRVPRSSLLLLDPARNRSDDNTVGSVTSREVKKNLWAEAEAQGISSQRIRFVYSYDEMLKRLALALL